MEPYNDEVSRSPTGLDRGPLATEEPEVCDCRCHRDRTLRHIGPCCRRCPGCGRRILLHMIKKHESRCQARAD